MLFEWISKWQRNSNRYDVIQFDRRYGRTVQVIGKLMLGILLCCTSHPAKGRMSFEVKFAKKITMIIAELGG